MSSTALTLEQVLEEVGFNARIEARGEARGVAIGEARGIAKGEARGQEVKAVEIAQNMLKSGFPVEQVAELSGLDIEKVKALTGNPA